MKTTTKVPAKPVASTNKFTPLHDRLLIKRVVAEVVSKGGIHIPDSAQDERPPEGTVVAVGNGKVLEDGTVRPLQVKVGDRILLGKYSGAEVRVDGVDMLIIREDEVLGVLS